LSRSGGDRHVKVEGREEELGGLAPVISVRRPMVELPAIAKTFSL
jgi:hypothetical protein